MRDDASRARLEEMGFALYLPRSRRAAASGGRMHASAGPAHRRARVALIARDAGASPHALLAGVARALAFARVEATIAPDVARAGDAGGLVVFGAPLAREIEAALPAERRKIEWVGAAEPADVAGSVAAKRALWSDLKRLARALSNPGG